MKRARAGIQSRREADLSMARNFDELLLPTAFAQQRAHPPRRRLCPLDNDLSRVNHVGETDLSQSELGHKIRRKLSRGDLRDAAASDPAPPLPSPPPPPPPTPPQQQQQQQAEAPSPTMGQYEAELAGRAPPRGKRMAPPIRPAPRRGAPAAPEAPRSAEGSALSPEEQQARRDLHEMLMRCPPLPNFSPSPAPTPSPPPKSPSDIHPALRPCFSFNDLPGATMNRPPGVADPGSKIPMPIPSPRTRGPAVVRSPGIAAQTVSDLPLRAVSEGARSSSHLPIPPRNSRRLQTSVSHAELLFRGNAFAQAQAREQAKEASKIPVRAHREVPVSQATTPTSRQVRFDGTAQQAQTPRRRPRAQTNPPVVRDATNTLSMVADEGDEPTEVTELTPRPAFATESQIRELIRLGQAIETPPDSVQVPHSEFNWSTSNERRRRGTDASSPADPPDTPSASRSRFRRFARDVFAPHTDPLPQGEWSPRSPSTPILPTDRQQQDHSSDTGDRLSAEFESAINLWTQAAPFAAQEQRDSHVDSQSSVYSQESYRSSISRSSMSDQLLRKEMGLEPLRNRASDQPKHPNHEYEFNTIKLMCYEVHTPRSPLLPPSATGPNPPGTASAHAAAYAVGSPYDADLYRRQQPHEPRKCHNCNEYCCHYGKLLVHSRMRTIAYDVRARTARRVLVQACDTLRTRKPNGSEEFDTFLKCGQCEEVYCPRCITLCSETLCRDPVCVRCIEERGEARCWIHNTV